ncbi:hypothetical protein P3T37_000163 [Kitasatospora sp. MAA4]|uniref:hypothetical protein n=1 Tax=Kitasatospora sp. MAA4 TaxID=3035093 RepID=UPI00247308CF|nr:hypothetical protein [Kitasatospora sp. MAA4]MDH6130796.1 hypothetical protein [Kitasatospora sp. MAA4]
MAWIRSFAMFWYDFVVGDDWRVAIGVAAGLGATAGLAHAGVNAWWLLPTVVAVLLGVSVRRVVKAARRS